jgi:hypothetical protein
VPGVSRSEKWTLIHGLIDRGLLRDVGGVLFLTGSGREAIERTKP